MRWVHVRQQMQTMFAVRDPERLIFAVLAYTLVFTLLLLAGRHLLTLPVRYVRIDGQLQNIAPDMVKTMSADAVGQPFLTVDLDEIAAAIAGIPWVAEVSVARQWPDTLVIHVAEHHPLVRWGEMEFLEARAQRFFIGTTKGFEQLPRLQGPVGREREMLQTLHSLNRRLAAVNGRVVQLNLSDRWAWSLQLQDGTGFLCGRQEPVAALQRWLDWVPALGEQRRKTMFSIDLRYPGGFAVVWRPERSIMEPAETMDPLPM